LISLADEASSEISFNNLDTLLFIVISRSHYGIRKEIQLNFNHCGSATLCVTLYRYFFCTKITVAFKDIITRVVTDTV
jgi:hypothetical protein